MTSPPPPPEMRPLADRGPFCVDTRPDLVGRHYQEVLDVLGWEGPVVGNKAHAWNAGARPADPAAALLRPGHVRVVHRRKVVTRVLVTRPLGPDERAMVAGTYRVCLALVPAGVSRNDGDPWWRFWYDAAVDAAIVAALRYDPARGTAKTTYAGETFRLYGPRWALDAQRASSRVTPFSQLDRALEWERAVNLQAPPVRPPSAPPTPAEVDRLLASVWPASAAYERARVAAYLGLADEPRTLAEIAVTCGLTKQAIGMTVRKFRDDTRNPTAERLLAEAAASRG